MRRLTRSFKLRKGFHDDYVSPTNKISLRKYEIHQKIKIISVFQPHRYSRLKLLKDFHHLLRLNLVILCPVYAAGEKLIKVTTK